MRKLLVALAALSLAGCYRIHYITGAPQESGVPNQEQWHHNFIQGLWEASEPVDVTSICPNGLARVDNQVTVMNWLAGVGVQLLAEVPISVLTSTSNNPGGYGGWIPIIWSPSTVSVFCAIPGQMVPNAPGQQPYLQPPPGQYSPQQAPQGQYPQQPPPQGQYPQQQYPPPGQPPPSYPPPPPSYPPPPPPPH